MKLFRVLEYNDDPDSTERAGDAAFHESPDIDWENKPGSGHEPEDALREKLHDLINELPLDWLINDAWSLTISPEGYKVLPDVEES
jgi:hypothetical protein